MEREVTVVGSQAHCHPWIHEPFERVIDHKSGIELLNNSIAQNKIKLALIEGKSGSGKTIFAKVYEHCSKNALYINPLFLTPAERNNVAHLMFGNYDTYIIDEVWQCNQYNLDIGVMNALDRGATVLLLTQQLNDIHITLTRKAVAFSISHGKTGNCELEPRFELET